MTDTHAPADVSLSRPLGTETPRHPAFRRDNAETPSQTPGLKALARLVLSRDGRRDTERDRVSRPTRPIDTSAETVGTGAEEERAAIVEYDGCVPRAWAKGFARLQPDRPPGDVTAKRWLVLIDDIGRFLDSPLCAVAAALGWGSLDLFGCDRDRPFSRIDCAGLLWLLNGRRLVELSQNTATVETRAGARQTYRRKPSELGRVLVWELAS